MLIETPEMEGLAMYRTINAVLIAIGSCGCGAGINTDYSGVDLVQVSGIVTLDGAAVADATVLFEATDGTASVGTTDASGEFYLRFNSEKAGVLAGRKTVRISMTSPASDEESGGEVDEGADPDTVAKVNPDELVPACYNLQSRLKVNVTDDTDWFEFDLKGDCSTTGPR